MRPIFRTLLLLCITVATSAVAQTTDLLHDHTLTSPADVIDGALHPGLIADSDAYRLYFVVVSELPNPTDELKARQMAHLKKIGLQDNDLGSFIVALEEFKVQYTNLVARYNESAEASQRAGVKPDIDSFLLQRDMLVQATRDSMKSTLTADGFSQLEVHVQREKSHMKVAVRGAQ